MVEVITEIVIDRPITEVSTYAADPDNAAEWYENIKSAEWETKKTLQVGSKITFRARFLGRDLTYTYEIIEYNPQQKLVMKTAEGPFPMETTYIWKEMEGGQTQMTLRNAGEPSGFSRVLAPLMTSAMKSTNQKDLKKIKEILEKN